MFICYFQDVASYSLHPGLVNSELFNKDDGIILKMSNLLVKVIARVSLNIKIEKNSLN